MKFVDFLCRDLSEPKFYLYSSLDFILDPSTVSSSNLVFNLRWSVFATDIQKQLEQNIRLRRWDPTPYRLTYLQIMNNYAAKPFESQPVMKVLTISICSFIVNATMCSIHVSVDFIRPECLPTFPTEMRSTATGYMVAAITLFNHTFAFRTSFTMLIGPFIE